VIPIVHAGDNLRITGWGADLGPDPVVGDSLDLTYNNLAGIRLRRQRCTGVSPDTPFCEFGEVPVGQEEGIILTGRVQRALILVPESLTHQWFVELLRRFNLWFHIFDEERCVEIENAAPGANPFLDAQLVLTTIGLFREKSRRLREALDAGWDIVVVDEAHHLGWSRAQTKVVIGDGADWIWNIAEQHFPGAIQIVDLFHARQHLWELAAALYPNNPLRQQRWLSHKLQWLDHGQIGKLVSAIRAAMDRYPKAADTIRLEANYFEKNAHRLRYPEFRRRHLFVGSGVIEAGCKTVLGARLKQSGMHWTVKGANAIIALRCCQLSSRWEEFWEARALG
jgi:hypothetical protein